MTKSSIASGTHRKGPVAKAVVAGIRAPIGSLIAGFEIEEPRFTVLRKF